ncbi:MAG TPA: gfo/Idh/MocA family oxidoreductase, partial [bacterium]|nr:gfo/Idh/MocA family oxidoreductase [bacterium]
SSLISDEEKEKILAPDNSEADNIAQDPKAVGIRGHMIQIQDLVNAVNENRDPMVTGEQARSAVDLILAIYKSSQTGREADV